MRNQMSVRCLRAQIYQRKSRKERPVIAELLPDVDPDIVRRFGTLADDSRVRRAAAALEANGISVLRAANAAEAKEIVLGLIAD